MSRLLLILVALVGFNCSNEKQTGSENAREDTQTVANLSEPTATPPKDWIEQRVSNAEKRLAETEGGQLLWKALETHGGLDRWYANGPLYFRFNSQNLKTGGPDTYQTIDIWSAKARLQLVSDTTIFNGGI